MDPPTRTGQRTRVGGLRADEAIRIGPDPDFERFERSLQRSRRRRAAPPGRTGWRWRHAAPVGAALAAWWLLVAAPELDRDAPAPGGRGGSAAPGRASSAVGDTAIPVDDAVDEAWRYARERGGLVSLAVIDSGGRMRSFEGEREYVSASIVKALLLAAELDRLEAGGLPLDGGSATRASTRRRVAPGWRASASPVTGGMPRSRPRIWRASCGGSTPCSRAPIASSGSACWQASPRRSAGEYRRARGRSGTFASREGGEAPRRASSSIRPPSCAARTGASRSRSSPTRSRLRATRSRPFAGSPTGSSGRSAARGGREGGAAERESRLDQSPSEGRSTGILTGSGPSPGTISSGS